MPIELTYRVVEQTFMDGSVEVTQYHAEYKSIDHRWIKCSLSYEWIHEAFDAVEFHRETGKGSQGIRLHYMPEPALAD